MKLVNRKVARGETMDEGCYMCKYFDKDGNGSTLVTQPYNLVKDRTMTLEGMREASRMLGNFAFTIPLHYFGEGEGMQRGHNQPNKAYMTLNDIMHEAKKLPKASEDRKWIVESCLLWTAEFKNFMAKIF